MGFDLDLGHAVLPHLEGSFAVAKSGNGGNAGGNGAGNHGGGENERGGGDRGSDGNRVLVQAAVDMVLPSAIQAVRTRTPTLAQETSPPRAPAQLRPVRSIAGGFFMGQPRVSA